MPAWLELDWDLTSFDIEHAIYPGTKTAPEYTGNIVIVDFEVVDTEGPWGENITNIPDYVLGGLVQDGTANANHVIFVKGSAGLTVGGYARVFESNFAEAANNMVTVQSGAAGYTAGGYVYAEGTVATISAHGNEVDITGEATASYNAYGGAAFAIDIATEGDTFATADNNTLSITKGDADTLLGGYAHIGPKSEYAPAQSGNANATAGASGNTLSITEVERIDGHVVGGEADAITQNGAATATANNNTLSFISNVQQTWGYAFVLGGEASATSSGGVVNATASGNTVTIGGDSVIGNVGTGSLDPSMAYIVGGLAIAMSEGGNAAATANNNTVIVTDNAEIIGNVYGAVVDTLSFAGDSTAIATNNTVIVSGTPQLARASFYGHGILSEGALLATVLPEGATIPFPKTVNLVAIDPTSASNDGDNNTFVADRFAGEVKEVNRFDNYQFLLANNIGDGDVVLDIQGDAHTQLDGTTVGILSIDDGGKMLEAGDVITLINKTEGAYAETYDTRVKKGLFLVYDFEYSSDDNMLTATLTDVQTNPESKPFPEGRLAGMAFLKQKNELVSDLGLPYIARTLEGQPGLSFMPFALVEGGQSTYDTGSTVRIKGVSVLTGVAANQNYDRYNLILGAFFEGGWGRYHSRNGFDNGTIKGKGDLDYYGGGVLARVDTASGFYGQGFVSIGNAGTKFKSRDLTEIFDAKTSYDSDSTYYSAHAGVGYLYKFSQTLTADFFGRYLWIRYSGDSVNIDNEQLRFKAFDSHRLQLGGRAHYLFNNGFTGYAGAAWEYEFGSKAKSSASGYNLSAPDIKGSTGMGELGFTKQFGDSYPLFIDAGVRGYIGKREGFTANFKIGLTF